MRWFVRGDIDGFFGLFIDNLLQLMLIQVLCTTVVKLPAELVVGRILPAAAVSILIGNLFYAWQAYDLMRRTGRTDVTALPYGINTPSLFAYIFLVMAPVYQQTQNAQLAFQLGLFACFGSGLMETAGAFCADWLRRHTPRAALLTALAGVAITFISMNFIFQLFAAPAIAVLPTLVILFAYAARMKLPLRLPAGLVAVVLGAALAWGLRAAGLTDWEPSAASYTFSFCAPTLALKDLLAPLQDPMAWQYLSVIVPMGLFNIIGSLQNLESAEAGGDRYETRPSLLVNGIGTLVASLLGSPFPTTIYIGHPGWKAMGARAGYSLLNGVVIAGLCLIGGVTLVLRFVPLEATLGILLWIGIIMTAQAFQTVPRSHALAVAFGLIPAFASWAWEIFISPALRLGKIPVTHAIGDLAQGGLYLHGVFALHQGFLLTSMLFAAVLVYVIERQLLKAAAWLTAAAALSALGLIHAYTLTDFGPINRFAFTLIDGERVWVAAPQFTIAYLLGAGYLVLLHINKGLAPESLADDHADH